MVRVQESLSARSGTSHPPSCLGQTPASLVRNQSPPGASPAAAELERLSLNALRACFLPAERKAALEREFVSEFERLRDKHLT